MAQQLKDEAMAVLQHEIMSCKEKIKELQARTSSPESAEDVKWQQRKLNIIRCILQDAQKGGK